MKTTMKKEVIAWQMLVLVLGSASVLTIREYLLDKNEIEAETARANCVVELKKMGDNDWDACANVVWYKIKYAE